MSDGRPTGRAPPRGWVWPGTAGRLPCRMRRGAASRWPATSFGLDVRELDDLRPFRDFIAQERRVLLGGVADGIGAFGFEPFLRTPANSMILSTSALIFMMISRGVLARCSEPVPRHRFETLQARFVERRHVGQRRVRCEARDRERAQLAALDQRERRREAVEDDVDVAADEIGQRAARCPCTGRAPSSRRPSSLNSSPARWLEPPVPDRAEIELARLRLGKRDQFLHDFRRHARIDDQHERRAC